jgi:hypothetical protein
MPSRSSKSRLSRLLTFILSLTYKITPPPDLLGPYLFEMEFDNSIVVMTHPYDYGLTMILKKIVCQNQRILLK